MAIYKEKTKAFHDRHTRRQSFQVNDKVYLYNSCIKLFFGKLRSLWDSPYAVLESFDGGSVLISYIKSGQQFKVNDHRLKPYLTSAPPTLANDVSFSCVVKTQRRWSNKIYKTKLTKTRYNNQVLGKYRVNPQRAGLTLITELTWSNLGLK